MSEPQAITGLVEAATSQAWGAWAAQHPSLAAVIDSIKVRERLAASIRDTQEFKDAVDAYTSGMTQINIASKLLDLAQQLLPLLLAI